MSLKNSVAATGLVAVLGAAGLAGSVVAQDQRHGTEGGMMEGMDRGQMMDGMDHGGMMTGDEAQSGSGHDAHDDDASDETGSSATDAYRAANAEMHESMNIEYTGDADIDFAHGMIGHHRGAIDMARIMLEHGEDPDLRQLAEEIIDAQEAEIAFLQDWLAENAE